MFFTPFEEDQEMKKFLLMAAVAAVTLLADSQWASARRGCGGGRRHHCGSCGGCGMTMGCGGCGMTMGCGGCGMSHSGGGHVMSGGACPGGVCSATGGAALAQATGTEALLIVHLPEDATLTIDGEATTSTSSRRVFVTPALEKGKEYEYTLKAKVERNGKVEIATTKVTIRPGETSQVELKIPAEGVAAQ
jgi:uncharacterized protein (TIGR03000 family)